MEKKIYILTSTFSLKINEIKKQFPKKKFQIFIASKGKKYTENEIIDYFSDAYAIIAGTEKYSERVLNNLKNLSYISRCGVGVDSIDINKIKKKKIKLITTKNSHLKIVAEHAIAGLFAALKNISNFNAEVKKNIWKKDYVDTIYKKKIGFYGFGKIANQIQRNLRGFSNEFYYYDNKVNKNKFKTLKVNTLKNLFKISDIIFICASISNNRFSINKKILDSCSLKKKIIINTSRGELINENDLIKYLKKNKKSLYFSDVFSKEPYYGHMNKLENTIFTPHVSTYEPYFRSKMEIESVMNLAKIIK
jgi:D-3-phosphoglycerate dehydrogenase